MNVASFQAISHPSQTAYMSLAKHHRVRCWNSILTTSTRGLAFSVDGEHVALSDAGGSLAIFDVAKGVPLHLVQFPPLVQATAIVWRSNSELFVGCTDGVVAALRLSSLRNNAVRVLCSLQGQLELMRPSSQTVKSLNGCQMILCPP